jgi:hypothetical protein
MIVEVIPPVNPPPDMKGLLPVKKLLRGMVGFSS